MVSTNAGETPPSVVKLVVRLEGTDLVHHLSLPLSGADCGYAGVLAAARAFFSPTDLADTLLVENLLVGGIPTGTSLRLSSASVRAGDGFDPLTAQMASAGRGTDEPLALRVFRATPNGEEATGTEEGGGSDWLQVGDIAGLRIAAPSDDAMEEGGEDGEGGEEEGVEKEEEVEEEGEGAAGRELRFWVNGKEHHVAHPRPSTTLAEYLHSVGLTGTKVGCGEGGCGCCTVTLTSPAGVTPINACLRLLPALDGCVITTTEGIGSQADGFHPIQAAIADGSGSQCGYCTPGFVMNMYGLMESSAEGADEASIERHFDGNLCRCTGYRPILAAFKTFAADVADDGEDREVGVEVECRHASDMTLHDIEEASCGSHPTCGRDGLPCAKYRRAPPLPPTIAAIQANKRPLHFTHPDTGTEWYRPVSLAGLTRLMARLAAAGKAPRLLCANTAMGVEKYYPSDGDAAAVYRWDPSAAALDGCTVVEVKDVAELLAVAPTPKGGLAVGASVSITALIDALEGAAGEEGGDEEGKEGGGRPAPYCVMARHLRRVANVQVRNAGSWGGNLMLARSRPAFPSDIAVVLAVAGATLTVLKDPTSLATTTMSVEEFLSSDASLPLLLVSVELPPLPRSSSSGAPPSRVFSTFKTAARHVNAAAIVNAGIDLLMDPTKGTVAAATIVFNGLTASLLRATAVEKSLLGRPLSEATLRAAVAALDDDIATAGGASPDAHTTSAYRLALARSYLYKAVLQAQPGLPHRLASALRPFVAAEDRPVSSGTQKFGDGDPSLYPVSEAIPKLGSRLQASGEASYVSTLPASAHACLVYSSSAAAELVSLDPSPALRAPGVLRFITAADIPGPNRLGSPSEPLFFAVGEVVPCVGAPLGAVVATSRSAARAAAKAVAQTYAPPAAFRHIAPDLEEAIRQHRAAKEGDAEAAVAELVASGGHLRRRLPSLAFDPEPFALRSGNPDAVLAAARTAAASQAPSPAPHTISGRLHTGAQKHFYMEPHVTLATPQEDGCMELWSGTQNPCGTQKVVSSLLARPQHAITVKVRRNGGGFGGKISRHMAVAGAAAVAAAALRAPVMVCNERVDDLVMTGGREEMIVEYDAAYGADGVVHALRMELPCNMGWYVGESAGSLAMAVAFSDNAYFTPHYKAVGRPFTADVAPNAAARAPGVVQSILAHEVVMEHVARSLGLPMDVVQERNFYRAGQRTPAGVVIGSATHEWTLPALWSQMKADTDFAARKAAVADFNVANRWRKRGVSIAPVRYGIGTGFYKSGALVNIYPDGTVLVAHGGVEVGQGLSTKAAQAAAHELGIPIDHVKVSDTDTSKIPFNTVTGGSGTSEATAMAVRDAARALAASLAPYLAAAGGFSGAVRAAMRDGVQLSATGWWDNPVKEDQYSTCGVAVSEVEVDVLTGEVQVRATDILMDLGVAMNPAVDIGQLEGGFVMALGYLLSEEVQFDAEGQPLSLGTWHYKIPSAFDIPLRFNVRLAGAANPSGVYGSKASAEPPMSLVSSVYFAIKEALYSARSEAGQHGWFELPTPMTVQTILSLGLAAPDGFALR